MKPLPIRIKLTLWYAAVLTVTFALFGAAAFVAMRKSIETTVDESLRDRASGIQKLMQRVQPEGQERVQDELAEHSELREEGDLSQVSDPQGRWIYRSELMQRYEIPVHAAATPAIYSLQTKEVPVRVLATQLHMRNEI